MAKVTLADRLKIKTPKKGQAPAQPQQPTGAPASQPLQANKPPAQPKAAPAASVPGVNQKTEGANAPQTPAGRPAQTPKTPLMKALSDAQKHNIMTEVNQNLGARNLASNDPGLQALGREQKAKYGNPGDAPPRMPTAITQVKKPGLAKPVNPKSEAKTRVERKRGDETAPLDISDQATGALSVVKTPSGNTVQTDPDKTGTVGAPAKKQQSVHRTAIPANRAKQIAEVNTELGYKHLKSPDEAVQKLGRHLLSQASVGDKVNYHKKRLIGILRGAIKKNEDQLNDLRKNEKPLLYGPKGEVAVPADKPAKPKKKKSYEPKVKVTQAYSDPARFSAGKFVMNVLGNGSPIANKILAAAKHSVNKSLLEDSFEKLSKAEQNLHVDLLNQIWLGTLDASALVTLLKKD